LLAFENSLDEFIPVLKVLFLFFLLDLFFGIVLSVSVSVSVCVSEWVTGCSNYGACSSCWICVFRVNQSEEEW
jgi:hypothetical protein